MAKIIKTRPAPVRKYEYNPMEEYLEQLLQSRMNNTISLQTFKSEIKIGDDVMIKVIRPMPVPRPNPPRPVPRPAFAIQDQ